MAGATPSSSIRFRPRPQRRSGRVRTAAAARRKSTSTSDRDHEESEKEQPPTGRNKAMASSSRYLNRSTPGVYVTEIEAFGSSIVGVATSVPIFIGYTEFAGDPQTGASLYNQPVRLSSMTEFINHFGSSAPPVKFTVAPPPAAAETAGKSASGPSSPPLPDGGAMVPFASFNASAAATAAPFAVSGAKFEVRFPSSGASFFS